jgi:hypothetical protein
MDRFDDPVLLARDPTLELHARRLVAERAIGANLIVLDAVLFEQHPCLEQAAHSRSP